MLVVAEFISAASLNSLLLIAVA